MTILSHQEIFYCFIAKALLNHATIAWFSLDDGTLDGATLRALDEELMNHNGGYTPRRKRNAARFLTIEDTGINLRAAGIDYNSVVVESVSRADGGERVVIRGQGNGISVTGTVPILPEDSDKAVQVSQENKSDNTRGSERA